MMEIKKIPEEDKCIITLIGEVTVVHAEKMKNLLREALENSNNVVIDTIDIFDIGKGLVLTGGGGGSPSAVFQDFVDRLKEKKLHYFQIMCAVAHKLLGIIYSLLKKQEMYNEKFFENNLVKN